MVSACRAGTVFVRIARSLGGRSYWLRSRRARIQYSFSCTLAKTTDRIGGEPRPGEFRGTWPERVKAPVSSFNRLSGRQSEPSKYSQVRRAGAKDGVSGRWHDTTEDEAGSGRIHIARSNSVSGNTFSFSVKPNTS